MARQHLEKLDVTVTVTGLFDIICEVRYGVMICISESHEA